MNDIPPDVELSLPRGWRDALERADAEILAGRVVDSGRIMAKLQQAIREMAAETSETVASR